MEIIESKWQVCRDFNCAFVLGLAPLSNDIINKMVERMMIGKALELIEKAKKTGECVVLSYIPASADIILERNVTDKNVAISFTVLFKDYQKAVVFSETFGK